MIAPPGYPKIVSTPSSRSDNMTASDPLITFFFSSVTGGVRTAVSFRDINVYFYYSLFTIDYSPFSLLSLLTSHLSPLTIHHSPFTIHYSLLTIHYSLLTIHC